MIYGIDISHWQGSVDFARLVSNGVKFVIAKCSQMTSKDKNFDIYYNDASMVNMPFGAYIYVKATNYNEAVKEANFFVNAVKGKTFPCGVWLDIEDSVLKNLGRMYLTQIIDAEAEIIQKAGYKVGVYCSKSWYKNTLDSSDLEKRYPFWIAGYPSLDNGTIKESLRPSYGIMWQYSSKGSVAGISGNVDMDEAKVDLPSYMSAEAPKVVEATNTTPEPVKGSVCPYKEPTTNLYLGKSGMTANDIKWLQYMLNKKGNYGLTVDGKFGKFTDSSLKNYQRNAHLTVDGICGSKTRISLKS